MKTTARALTGISLMTPKTENMNLIKSRINCNTGFARRLIEKYEFSDSDFPPASFVMLKAGEEEEGQEEKGQIINLLLQILHSDSYVSNLVFQNFIINRIQAEIEFYLKQLGNRPGSGRERLEQIYGQVVEIVRTEQREQKKIWQNQAIVEKEKILEPLGLRTSAKMLLQTAENKLKTEKETAEKKQLSEIEKLYSQQEEKQISERRLEHRQTEIQQISDRLTEKNTERKIINHQVTEESVIKNSSLAEETREEFVLTFQDLSEKKRQIERRLWQFQREVNGEAHLPSPKAARVYTYLESLSEEQKDAMAQILGYDKTVLLERLKHADNQTWSQMEEHIEKRLDIVKQQLDAEIFQSTSENVKETEIISDEIGYETENMKKPGLEQWKYSIKEWLGFMEEKDWETFTTAVRESQTLISEKTKSVLKNGEKLEAVEYIEQIQDMEELLPVIRLIHQKENLRELAAGWLPEEETLLKQARLFEIAKQLTVTSASDNEVKKQLLESFTKVLDEKDWTEFTSQIKIEKIVRYLESMTEEKKKVMAETLGFDYKEMTKQIRQGFLTENNYLENKIISRLEQIDQSQEEKKLFLEQWKVYLKEWLSFMEIEDWNQVVRTIEQDEESISQNIKKAFAKGSKTQVMEFLEQAGPEEILPVVSFIYQDTKLNKLTEGWLPETETEFVRQTKTVDAGENRTESVQTLLEWKQIVESAKAGSEEEGRLGSPDSLEKTESEHTQLEKTVWESVLSSNIFETREQYTESLERILASEAEEILLPAAKMIYQHSETESEIEKTLKKDIETGKIKKIIAACSEEQWNYIKNMTASQVYKAVFMKEIEKSEEQKIIEQAAVSVVEKNLHYYRDMGFIQPSLNVHTTNTVRQNRQNYSQELFIKEVQQLSKLQEIQQLVELVHRTGELDGEAARQISQIEEAVKASKTENQLEEKIWSEIKQAVVLWARELNDKQWKKVEETILFASQRNKDIYAEELWRAALRDDVNETEAEQSRHIGYTNRGTLLQALEENRESLVLLRRSERESLDEHLRQASRQDRRMTLDSQLVLENQVYRQQTNLERQRIQAEEPEEFTYMPAQMVVTRPGGGIRERQAPPPAPDIETIVRQVKKETVNDIQFINRRQSEADEYKKNEQQLGELLNKLSGQQKELEQLKQVQARLIHSTDPGRLAETVMKQFRSQLQVEKMRRGM
ncbi:MAG: hypothetical protein Q4C69_08910 [Lachnoclostridium edouardi]|uniref:hypothetical protein n=1 Tax=Lachnoclostridium edouardi TaxID=1926283 RepID=UPI0026DD4DA2|nr:hypothetical protein [Lachnoclostridium edouardi]MDO4278934.1 hypothetical protein [Lachnoclostridium edouardi]